MVNTDASCGLATVRTMLQVPIPMQVIGGPECICKDAGPSVEGNIAVLLGPAIATGGHTASQRGVLISARGGTH